MVIVRDFDFPYVKKKSIATRTTLNLLYKLKNKLLFHYCYISVRNTRSGATAT